MKSLIYVFFNNVSYWTFRKGIIVVKDNTTFSSHPIRERFPLSPVKEMISKPLLFPPLLTSAVTKPFTGMDKALTSSMTFWTIVVLPTPTKERDENFNSLISWATWHECDSAVNCNFSPDNFKGMGSVSNILSHASPVLLFIQRINVKGFADTIFTAMGTKEKKSFPLSSCKLLCHSTFLTMDIISIYQTMEISHA